MSKLFWICFTAVTIRIWFFGIMVMVLSGFGAIQFPIVFFACLVAEAICAFAEFLQSPMTVTMHFNSVGPDPSDREAYMFSDYVMARFAQEGLEYGTVTLSAEKL